jgi:hypothetical protein
MAVGAPAFLPQIDWDRPWLDPWREPGQRVMQAIAAGATLPEALNRELTAPVRFVPQSKLPPGEAYERYIFNLNTAVA